MKKKHSVIISLILLVLSLIPVIMVMRYPVLDWVSGPILIYLIMSPIVIFEMILLFLLIKEKSVKIVLFVQTTLVLILFLLMFHYIQVH